MVKNFGGKKKFGEKAALQGLAKKTLANVDLHRQSKINSKTIDCRGALPPLYNLW